MAVETLAAATTVVPGQVGMQFRTTGQVVSALVVLAGLLLFWEGHKRTRRLRTFTESTPVASASTGETVTVAGSATVDRGAPRESKLNGDPCLVNYWKVKQAKRPTGGVGRDSRDWETLALEGTAVPFQVSDDTGTAVIGVDGEISDVDDRVDLGAATVATGPGGVDRVQRGEGRKQEWILAPGDEVAVRGTARPADDSGVDCRIDPADGLFLVKGGTEGAGSRRGLGRFIRGVGALVLLFGVVATGLAQGVI